MTQEDKELLLKDLCARLPYGVKAKVDGHINPLQVLGVSKLNKSTWAWKKETYVVTFWNDTKCIDNIVPYLRPMSSMTDEKLNKLQGLCIAYDSLYPLQHFTDVAKFLYEHLIDFDNLIEKGLALPAPEGMYDFK